MVPIIANILHSNNISPKGQKRVSKDTKGSLLFLCVKYRYKYGTERRNITVMLKVIA